MVLEYDIVIIGGGHAGVEAALSSAKLGNKTLLCTLNIKKILTCHVIPLLEEVQKE